MTNTSNLKQKYVAGSLERRPHDLRASPSASALLKLLSDHFGPASLSVLLFPLRNVSSYLSLAEAGHFLSAFDSSHTAIADAYLKAYRWGVYDRCQFTAVSEDRPFPYFAAEFDVILIAERPGTPAAPRHREVTSFLRQGGLFLRPADERTFVIEE